MRLKISPAGLMAAVMLMLLAASCKPTEKNYRAAYDVARGKREQEDRRREEIRAEMGVGGGVMQEVDGAALADIGGRKVWTRHISFAAADSVAPYAVSIATFSMDSNALALASDMCAQGWRAARAVKGGGHHFVLIGQSGSQTEALRIMDDFTGKHKDWQYVGQPGIMLIIGGSR